MKTNQRRADRELTSKFQVYTIHFPTIHYTLSTIHYRLSTIHYTFATIHYTLLTIHYTLATIHYTLSPYKIFHYTFTIHLLYTFIPCKKNIITSKAPIQKDLKFLIFFGECVCMFFSIPLLSYRFELDPEEQVMSV